MGIKAGKPGIRKAFKKSNGQTIYPGSRPETHYGGYDTRLGHGVIAVVYAEHIIKSNKMDDQDRIKQIRELAKKNPDEFLRQLFKS